MSNNVELAKSKFSSRLFAFGADLICIAITALLMVIGMQFIVANNSEYKHVTETLETIQQSSHLYVRNSGETIIVTKAYDAPKNESEYKELANIYDVRLKEFYSDPTFFDQTDSSSGMHLYDIRRIPEGETHTNLFVKDENGEIVPSLTASWKDLYDFYAEVINHDATAELMKNDEYMNLNRSITLTFVFVELLIPISLSIIIFEFIIPLFDRHGRRTLGKRALKIGVVDSRGLSPKFGRFLCRFLLFFFGEIALSVVALLLPLIISFSMVTFSKAGQSFHDYVAGTYVVDISQDFICKDESEYEKKHNLGDKFSPLSKELEIK